jgi:hypothetical protein
MVMKNLEQETLNLISLRFNVDEVVAKDILRMVSSMCSTQGAACSHIIDYINK